MLIPKELPQYQELQEHARNLPEMDPDAVIAVTQLLKISLDLQDALETNFAMYGLSQGRHQALMLVAKASAGEGATPAELAAAAGVTRATVTGLLDGLERDQLVKRTPSPTDRRSVNVKITPKGEAKLREILPDHARRLSAVMATLKPNEKRTLVKLLQKIGPGLSHLTAVAGA